LQISVLVIEPCKDTNWPARCGIRLTFFSKDSLLNGHCIVLSWIYCSKHTNTLYSHSKTNCLLRITRIKQLRKTKMTMTTIQADKKCLSHQRTIWWWHMCIPRGLKCGDYVTSVSILRTNNMDPYQEQICQYWLKMETNVTEILRYQSERKLRVCAYYSPPSDCSQWEYADVFVSVTFRSECVTIS
jgi:hypothetical protein